MPVSVTEHFKIDSSKFAATGAFDPLLDQDTHLFIDPFLLAGTKQPQFLDARERLLERFRDIIKLLAASKKPKDIFWNQAAKKLRFKEIAGFGLGYSKGGTSGSGIGPTFTLKLVDTANQIVKAGINDPEIFELIGIFEEGIGCDRISDMTAVILLPQFLKFTDAVFTACGMKFPGFTYKNEKYNIPEHPFRPKTPVLLTPREFLRDLPVAHDWGDIGYVCAANAELRDKLNQLLGVDWRKKTEGYSKHEVREFFLKNPELLKDLLASYKKSDRIKYNFDADPAGEVVWRSAATQCLVKFPLQIKKQASPKEAAEQICEHFKELIEANGLWRLLYQDEKCTKRKHERASQLLFHGIASSYCRANNLDISPESNGGSGPVDFKLSRGARGKTLVEAKLSTNGKLITGFEKQVSTYQRAEGADFVIYLILIVSKSDKVIERLKKRLEELDKAKKPRPAVVIVDGLPKKSASKR